MGLQPRGYDKVVRLIEKGVSIPNPLSLDIGEEVDVDRISAEGVTIHPGCRNYGAKTVISRGVTLGAEGPVTIEDCRLGPEVELKGGYFKQSVFLEKAGMGSGAHVREVCLLEEQATGAHCVGLKQTILLPFVTLGSLINFCDCLMAGGTSRDDHSEVGSSYIHFNFTPDGDKATASLFGDVPRGVMLNQPPIFLGGQGGAVGPVRVAFGTVVAAGSILRHDVIEGGRLVVAGTPAGFQRDRVPHAYSDLPGVVRKNLEYLANLAALEQWYKVVRRPFFASQELGELVFEGALEVLALARKERVERLAGMAQRVPASSAGGRELRERLDEIEAIFEADASLPGGGECAAALAAAASGGSQGYIQAVQDLTPGSRNAGVDWLQQIVDTLCRKAGMLLPSLGPFDRVQ